jgi:hypothetical protein
VNLGAASRCGITLSHCGYPLSPSSYPISYTVVLRTASHLSPECISKRRPSRSSTLPLPIRPPTATSNTLPHRRQSWLQTLRCLCNSSPHLPPSIRSTAHRRNQFPPSTLRRLHLTMHHQRLLAQVPLRIFQPILANCDRQSLPCTFLRFCDRRILHDGY